MGRVDNNPNTSSSSQHRAGKSFKYTAQRNLVFWLFSDYSIETAFANFAESVCDLLNYDKGNPTNL